MDADPSMSRSLEKLLEVRLFSVFRHHLKSADGRPLQREAIHHPGSVAIVPLLDDGRVCLISNRRFAVNDTLIEIPAGTLEPEEEPVDAARRELAEETGYRAGRIEPLPAYFPSPGVTTEKMHLFVAEQLAPGPPEREAGEQIENLLLPWEEAIAMALDGRIHDGKTLVGLLYVQCQRRTK